LLTFDGWGRVQSELENLPDEIHLEDHMTQMMDGLTTVAAIVREVDAPSINDSLRLIGGYWEELRGQSGRPCFARGERPDKEGMEILWIPYRSEM